MRAPTDSRPTISSTTALIYLRISVNRTSEHASIEQQRADCAALAIRLGLSQVREFVDEAVSAYQDQARPAYQHLLRCLDHENAGTVIVWHIDRLYRKPRELEQLLDLLDSRPVRIESVQGGSFDLNSHEGRLFARQLVAFANYESAHKGARVARAHQQRALQGLLHGGNNYGYQKDGSLHPHESLVAWRIADDYLTGLSPSVIARELTSEKVHTPTGGSHWRSTTIESILRSQRLHRQRGPIKGTWEGLVTPDESVLIHALLLAPRRDAARSSKHLLSGIARCGSCMTRLVSATSRHGKALYRCKTSPKSCGRLSAPAGPLEAAVVKHLATHVRGCASSFTPAKSPAMLLKEMQQDAAARFLLAAGYGSGQLSRTDFYTQRASASQRYSDQIAELNRYLRIRVLDRYPDPADHIPMLTISRQRLLVDALLCRISVHREDRAWRLRLTCRA